MNITDEATGLASSIEARLTEELARRVMGWGSAPGRFLKSDRSWIPRWRFQPTERLVDTFRLLEQAAPEAYLMQGDNKSNFKVSVQIGGRTGEAHGRSKSRAITYAIARAIGLEVDL